MEPRGGRSLQGSDPRAIRQAGQRVLRDRAALGRRRDRSRRDARGARPGARRRPQRAAARADAVRCVSDVVLTLICRPRAGGDPVIIEQSGGAWPCQITTAVCTGSRLSLRSAGTTARISIYVTASGANASISVTTSITAGRSALIASASCAKFILLKVQSDRPPSVCSPP